MYNIQALETIQIVKHNVYFQERPENIGKVKVW